MRCCQYPSYVDGPEALCFRVVRPSLRLCVRPDEGISDRLAVDFQFGCCFRPEVWSTVSL